jgi:hypothetical protein
MDEVLWEDKYGQLDIRKYNLPSARTKAGLSSKRE